MKLNFRPVRAPDELGGVKIPYVGRRQAHRFTWYLVLVLVLSPIIYLTARAIVTSFSRTANGTVDLGQQEIRASGSGSVRELSVNAGDEVARGQGLFVLDSAELDAEAARNAALLAAAEVTDREARQLRGAALEELALQRRSVEYQRNRRRAIEELFHEGAATLAELDEATAAVAAAEMSLMHMQRELTARTSPPQVTYVERAVLNSRRGALTAHSPCSGRVLAVLVKVGEYVSAGEPMMVVAQLDHPHVLAYVSPRLGTGLAVGTAAAIYFPDGTRIQASISGTPKLTARMPADLVDQFGLRPMTVVLDLAPQQSWPQGQLVQGLPVTVRFQLGWEATAVGAWLGQALGWLAR
jgi:multidrug resistance efflux pump